MTVAYGTTGEQINHEEIVSSTIPVQNDGSAPGEHCAVMNSERDQQSGFGVYSQAQRQM
jgi:hypothetical protein